MAKSQAVETLEQSVAERNAELPPSVRHMLDTVTAELQEFGEQDAISVTVDILDRILSSATVEDVFAGLGQVTHSDDLMGKMIEVRDVTWRSSDYKGETSVGFYGIIEYVDLATGSADVASFGSLNCMAQLFAMKRLNAFPQRLVLTQTNKPTENGYYPQFFRPFNEEDAGRLAHLRDLLSRSES